MNEYTSEVTGNTEADKEYNAWLDSLSKLSDLEISREIFNRIYNHSDIDDKDKAILKDSYDYCIKLISQGKPLEIDLLKIYLEDVKGHKNVTDINLSLLITMLGMCGIIFTK